MLKNYWRSISGPVLNLNETYFINNFIKMNNFFPKSPRSQFGTVVSDVQYQICDSFMKFASDQLIQK